MTYANGTVFDGTWFSDKRTDGRQTWSDGRVYLGEWKGDLRHTHTRPRKAVTS